MRHKTFLVITAKKNAMDSPTIKLPVSASSGSEEPPFVWQEEVAVTEGRVGHTGKIQGRLRIWQPTCHQKDNARRLNCDTFQEI
jgi:hypothetical protein